MGAIAKVKERKNGAVAEVCKVMFLGYVLVVIEQIDAVFDLVSGIKGVLGFLQSNNEFQEVRLEEIVRFVYMAGDGGRYWGFKSLVERERLR